MLPDLAEAMVLSSDVFVCYVTLPVSFVIALGVPPVGHPASAFYADCAAILEERISAHRARFN